MKLCKDCNKKISQVASRCKSCSNRFRTGKYNSNNLLKLNKNNPMWKGNKVGYSALHAWVRRNKLKLKFCEKCNKNKKLDVSNISGKYKRDVNDYEWLCKKCHRRKDIKNNKK